jgi:hypothetical protein
LPVLALAGSVFKVVPFAELGCSSCPQPSANTATVARDSKMGFTLSLLLSVLNYSHAAAF